MHLGRRDEIKVCAAADACQTLTVAENRVFNSTHLYVDQVYTGATAIGATLYHRDTTIPLAWDASAADVEGAAVTPSWVSAPYIDGEYLSPTAAAKFTACCKGTFDFDRWPLATMSQNV